MRKYLMPMLAIVALGLATPATAYDSGDLISMQAALRIATDLGLASVSHTQFLGDEWEIEGRDLSGRYMEVYVDANTGEKLHEYRFNIFFTAIVSNRVGWTNLAVNSSGQAVAVQGVPGILSGAVIAISRDASGTWAAPVTVAASGVYRQRQPKVGLGNEGTAVLVYLVNAGVRYSVRSGGIWSAPASLISSGAGGVAGVAVDGSGNAVAAYVQTTISPGTYTVYRPVGGSFQPKVQINSSTQVVATPAGTFVAGGTTISTRLAGSSTWNQTTFANSQLVNAAAGLAIAVGAPQVSVSTAAVP